MMTVTAILCLPPSLDVLEAARKGDRRRHPLDRWFGRVLVSASSIEETF
jgi:hypothetical protein